jgi:N-acetylglucosaminyldiphosphoundecaprenol N-acetyl-beta-D-mannosaminyltransferase
LLSIIYTQKQLITTINHYLCCIAENDFNFKKSLQNLDILLPDDVGIVIAVKLLKKNKKNCWWRYSSVFTG